MGAVTSNWWGQWGQTLNLVNHVGKQTPEHLQIFPYFFTHPPISFPFGKHSFPPPCIYGSVPVLFCLFIFLFLHSTYNWNNIIFVFLWCISLKIIPSRSIYVVTSGKILFFFIAVFFFIGVSIHLSMST